MRIASRWSALVSPPVLAILAACGSGGGTQPPVAASANVQGVEDEVLIGALSASAATGDALRFVVTTPPASGQVQVQESTGAFEYLGRADFNGHDGFEFVAIDPRGVRSLPAVVGITISAVNDAPRIKKVPDAQNSPESYEVLVRVDVVDVDSSQVDLSVDVEDASIVSALVDSDGRTVRLIPGAVGRTMVTVRASDGDLTTADEFAFTVGPVTKVRRFSISDPGASGIQIVNTSQRDARFRLRHNGSVLAGSIEEIVEEALAADDSASPVIARRLWAYLNNRTYHWYSLTGGRWVHDPLIMLNSVGFGLCDDVATALVLMGRSAGLEANVWSLEGHVVAELGSDDDRAIYDPDLSVYYHKRDRSLASVEALSDDPTLITSPTEPILDASSPWVAYSEPLATYYASQTDNTISDWYTAASPPLSGEIRLPGGAKVTYPGIWSTAPTFSGAEGTEAPTYANLMVTLPAGWTGVFPMPLVLKAIRGAGRVRVGTGEYEVADPVLGVSLNVSPNWIAEIEVLRADSALELVFLLNPLRFGVAESTEIAVTSLDAWAIEPTVVFFSPEESVAHETLQSIRKPVAR